jgi:SAM-dependent methyltransferase
MNKALFEILSRLRAIAMTTLKPISTYWLAKPSVKPLSSKFGFDRGAPIDRYYIDLFVSQNKKHIKGRVLEIGDNIYTKTYGKKKVVISDVLDINTKNKKANIIDDLRTLSTVADNTYDCVILTHVLGMIDDMPAAVKQLHRILKPGGVIIVTLSCFSPSHDDNISYWRFTKYSGEYVFMSMFKKKNIKAETFGNVLSSQCFWVGAAQSDLTKEQLDFNDRHFPCIVGVLVQK